MPIQRWFFQTCGALLAALVVVGCGSESKDNANSLSSRPPAEAKGNKPEPSPPAPGENAKMQDRARELLMQLLEAPNKQNYLALREFLIQSDAYQPYSRELDKAMDLFEEDKKEEARDLLMRSLDNLILSPRAHQMLSMCHDDTGDADAAKLERDLFFACIEGILDTGDGSEDAPYVVARASDEHDVVGYLRKRFVKQSLVEKNGKYFDHLECADGTVLVFDITAAYLKLAERVSQ